VKSVAIIGIGSPHGPDQMGWQAIESLKKDHALQALNSDSIKILSLDRPGMALLDYLNGVDYAILIDAIAGGTAGTIVEIDKEQLQSESILFSSHSAGVAEALAMGAAISTLPQNIDIFAIQIGDLSSLYNPNLSTFKQLKQLVFDHIQSHLDL